MLLTLFLSISTLSPIKFTETTIPCSNVKYVFTIEGAKNTYIATRREEYLTPYSYLKDLQEQIDRQCNPKKK